LRVTQIDLLRQTRSTKQAGLTYRQRITNKAGSLKIARKAQRSFGNLNFLEKSNQISRVGVILVDDVLTTGATLKECENALNQLGLKILAATAIAKS
jgi:predicted amidophosphoribosyltransferase